MGRNGLKYRKLKIFGIAAGLAGVLLLAGCTKTAAGSSYGNGKETLITGYGTTVVIEGVGAAADEMCIRDRDDKLLEASREFYAKHSINYGIGRVP